jgi:hypothetical protein
MAKSPDDAVASMIANLNEKTGKDLAAWLKIASASKLAKHGEIVKHLKDQHGVTHGYAVLIAHKALEAAQGGPTGDDDLLEAQYAGAKAALHPIYERIVEAVRAFGGDVELAPKKGYVSLRRSKQFALVQPSTATRVDVGIQLKGVAASGRLEASGSFNAMVSHRVRLTDASEVDAELVGWLRQAYLLA